MTTRDLSTVMPQLKTERAALEPMNRTVTHTLSLATDRRLLDVDTREQHARCVPCTRGARRDAYFWDRWDWKVRGEDDLRRFFEIARRLGGHLRDLHSAEVEQLLPGSVHKIVGRRTDLFLPDYWLFVLHHLGWTGQLPYECETRWIAGHTFSDRPFSLFSKLPVNVVQASIDALTVLIESAPECVLPPDVGPGTSTSNLSGGSRADGLTVTLRPPRTGERRTKKRAERAVNMEAIKKELLLHIKAARDHAQAAIDFGREPELLPRPSQQELAWRIGITKSAASRCFNDPAASELNLLWNTAEDLEAILRFVRS